MTFFVLSVFPAPDSPLRTFSDVPRYDLEDVRDQDALVLAFLSHVDPCTLGNRKDMRRIFITPLAAILLYYSVGIKRQGLVGIDGDQEQARIGLREM